MIGAPVQRLALQTLQDAQDTVVSPTSNITGSKALVFATSIGADSLVIVSASDDTAGGLNTYNVVQTIGAQSIAMNVIEITVVTPILTTNSITFHILAAGNFNRWFHIYEVSGLKTNAFDQGVTAAVGGGQGSVGPTGTLAQTNEIVFGYFFNANDNPISYTPGSGYTGLTPLASPSQANATLEYQIVSSTAPVTPTVTWSRTDAGYDAIAATFMGTPDQGALSVPGPPSVGGRFHL